MSKGIELTQSQIKAYENGATKFLFPIDEKYKNKIPNNAKEVELLVFAQMTCPIWINDKDIFVKEEFVIDFKGKIFYRNTIDERQLFIDNFNSNSLKATQMTKEQSRYSFSECIDIKVIRVQDIEIDDLIKMYDKKSCDEDGIMLYENAEDMAYALDIDYEANDYVFLIEFKR